MKQPPQTDGGTPSVYLADADGPDVRHNLIKALAAHWKNASAGRAAEKDGRGADDE